MSGKFSIVSVGPGDPELITLKAARMIASSEVVAWFSAARSTGRARETAARHISPQAKTLRFVYPFTTSVPVEHARYLDEMWAFYDTCASTIAQELEAGRTVALLCEGDAFLYGSAMYLHDRLSERYACDITPGITGMSGCWSAAGLPMAHGDDVLTVLPCTLGPERLLAEVESGGAFVFMKIGRNLPKLRAVLKASGLETTAFYIEHATRADQKIMPFKEAPEQAPYFSMVLVPGRRGRR